MKKVRNTAILLLIIFSSVYLSGCTFIAGKEQVYFYERPAIGFTVEDEVKTDIDLEKQTSLDLASGNGTIRITPYDGEKLQIIEKGSSQAPPQKWR